VEVTAASQDHGRGLPEGQLGKLSRDCRESGQAGRLRAAVGMGSGEVSALQATSHLLVKSIQAASVQMCHFVFTTVLRGAFFFFVLFVVGLAF
jgi:hypothetical protein